MNKLIFVFCIWSIQVMASFQIPRLTGPVVDDAHMIAYQYRDTMSALALRFKEQKGVQLQILTVEGLDGLSIEQASIMVADKWKLGNADTDKAVLLMIAKDERKIRIEVGQGLEGDIPDAVAKRIIEENIRPFFRAGDFNSGVMAGFLQIAKYAIPDLDLDRLLQDAPVRYKKREGGIPLIILIPLIIFLAMSRSGLFGMFLLGSLAGGRSSRGGFSGNSWSGGGGGFSGGGASGGW